MLEMCSAMYSITQSLSSFVNRSSCELPIDKARLLAPVCFTGDYYNFDRWF